MRGTLLCVLALLALARPLAATVVVRLDLPDLVQRAEVIVEARCLAVAVERDAEGRPRTRVRLAVDRGWRGAQDGQVYEFTVPGGVLDGRRLVIPGMPAFSPGDELVLFLTAPSRAGHRLPVGLGQGRYRIRRDPSSGARSLERPLSGLELVDREGRPVEDVASQGELSYGLLIARLKVELAKPTPKAR